MSDIYFSDTKSKAVFSAEGPKPQFLIDTPKFKALVDGVITGMMKSGEFDRLYKKWFMSPIPPKNINLNLPMSAQLRDSLKAPSDKPAL